jgi:hypothetical protein
MSETLFELPPAKPPVQFDSKVGKPRLERPNRVHVRVCAHEIELDHPALPGSWGRRQLSLNWIDVMPTHSLVRSYRRRRSGCERGGEGKRHILRGEVDRLIAALYVEGDLAIRLPLALDEAERQRGQRLFNAGLACGRSSSRRGASLQIGDFRRPPVLCDSLPRD